MCRQRDVPPKTTAETGNPMWPSVLILCFLLGARPLKGADASIHCRPDAPESTRWAAQELQRLILRATGCEFAVSLGPFRPPPSVLFRMSPCHTTVSSSDWKTAPSLLRGTTRHPMGLGARRATARCGAFANSRSGCSACAGFSGATGGGHSREPVVTLRAGPADPGAAGLCSASGRLPWRKRAGKSDTLSYQLSMTTGVFPLRRGRPLAAHGNAVGLIRYQTGSPERAPHEEATLSDGPGR